MGDGLQGAAISAEAFLHGFLFGYSVIDYWVLIDD